MILGKTKWVGLILTMLVAGMASAQPATRPAFGGGAAGAGGRGEMLFQRLHDAMSDLNLTDDQKSQIEDIFSKAKDDFQQLAPQLRTMEQQERQEKIRDLIMGVREKVTGVLTDDQKQKLQEKLQSMRGGGAGRAFNGANLRAAGAAGAAGANPAPAQPGELPARVQQPLQRLEDSIATLGLTGEQKTQVQSIIDDGKKQLNDVREKVQNGSAQPDEMRTESQQVFAAMRDQLAGVLTADQQQKLRDSIQSRFDQANTPATPTTRPAMMTEPTEPRMPPQRAEMRDSEPSGPAAKVQSLAPETGPKIGEASPELSLEALNGRNVQLSAFKGKPLVIEFGSYTSPSFRQRAAKMEELARTYGARASFLIVYTKEAHATGEWELDRNHDDGVRVAKHADLGARKTAAKDAKQSLKINIPIAVDSMDDSAMNAFGAGENSAVVVRDGKIVAKEAWCDPYRLRAALDDATSAKPTTQQVD